jgi:sulfide dehydrogenase [flavocytochrome c] flavoprotein subunit
MQANSGRRRFLRAVGLAAGAVAARGMAHAASSSARVVVIGGGYGGATCARYLRLWSGGAIEVLLIEREAAFVSCPLSNLVLGGSRNIDEITHDYQGLRGHGVQVLRDSVVGVDAATRKVRLARGEELFYDRLVVSPGVDFIYEQIAGLDAEAQKTVLHAWKAGAETVALRKQLEEMRDGGIFVISIPRTPYRCPPGPYERACQVASYFKRVKPRAKVLILDANEDVTSKPALFKTAWRELYGGIVEYRNNMEVTEVNARGKAVKTDFDTVKGDVLNVLPPMRAGDIARASGLITANNRWCGVDWLSMESLAVQGVHVLGDSVLPGPAMPKSGHMANQHGKLAASAIIEMLNGRQPLPEPVLSNTCYSFVSDREAIHISSVHRYDSAGKTFIPVAGAGGVSVQRSETEGNFGFAWAKNIWSEMLG